MIRETIRTGPGLAIAFLLVILMVLGVTATIVVLRSTSIAVAQVVQYLQWVYPAIIFIAMWPITIVVTSCLTMLMCAHRHDKWMHLYGSAELKRRILDYQNRCAERGREIVRQRNRNGAILAAIRGAAGHNAHVAQALEGIPELYGGDNPPQEIVHE